MLRTSPKNVNIKSGGLYGLLHFFEVKVLNFWDETSIEKVYKRIRILIIIVGLPSLASTFQLISLDSYKFFLPFQIKGFPVNLHFAVISPLEVMVPTLSPRAVPTGDPYILLLTAIFLVSIAGALFLSWWGSSHAPQCIPPDTTLSGM